MSKAPKEKEIGTTRLQLLVDKITTSGSNNVDCSLVEETINICSESSSTVSDLFRFVTVQLRRNHAQIRLGVLRLLRLLSSPQAIVRQLTLNMNDATKFIPLAKCLRNLILDNLQDTFSYIVQLESYSAPMLLPKEAAKELQFEGIKLLLDWEYELEQGHFDVTPWNFDPSPPLSWVPSQRAKGQLKAFINFLNLDSRPLEQRKQKSQLFKSEVIKSHRLLNDCLNEIEECSESVEENLVSLSTILEILVPNPTSESSEIDKTEIIENQSETDHKSMTTMNSFDSLRLHGCLPGSSSGFGLGSTLTIEIQLPCNSQVNSSRASFEPKIYIKRSTETKELEESATTFARLAAEKHRPKLTDYLQTLESTHSMNFAAKLSSKRNEKIEILKQWISRIQTLTSLFYDRIEFIDSEPIHRVNNPARTSISSDDSDFEEVVNTTSDTGKSLCYPSSLHENLSCGRIESINTRSLSVVNSDPNQQIVQLTNEDQPKSRKDGTVVTVAPRQLFCWAPLLSGSLCHRCDPSGRCPIHGRIVKRDKITGRPINMNDRKLLQTEMESKRLARQKKLDEEIKKKARRHYPGLTNISKKEVGVRGRLEAQVMKKKALRKRS
ncbi:unnamed protein product [Schistosoma mattheei]|uniref:UV-stimulated scaffold protein A C-terminal domain-containing protein n=1 Tax=Schistosoma mattheei TaxID=31246 RepID=A0AA85BSS1_9TREM|nr:unnamed protein product [Schistosoma mattheei]